MKSRFEKELSGELGDFWKKHAEESIEDMKKQAYDGEILLDDNCAVYWKTSGHYLPSDCVEILKHTGFPFNEEATTMAREAQDAEAIERYLKASHEPTEEEFYEMRAAFGKGTKVVDIISGEVYIA